MKTPLSWLKDYVDIDLSLEELAKVMTALGLEVEEITLVGLPLPPGEMHEFKYTGLAWDPDKIVVAQIEEVMPHPNADRLTLCRLNDGRQEWIVLTGAPNLYEYKGAGALPKPLKVAYAREGARIYDGHQPGQVLTTLKRTKIRGVESFSMVCSEKELGISEDHEGIIILDDDAPTGMPLVDYMGDAVFEIKMLPNMIRDACMVGIAREIAAATGKTLRLPKVQYTPQGESIEGKVKIQITAPELNPRFTLGMVRQITPRPSPYWAQRRLKLAGMRPIDSVVDATNYVMLELGEPLHAFDYDVLVQRAGGKAPTIITRQAQPGERLKTLDGVDRPLDPFTVLVCDTAGGLSIAGVMGGAESEVTAATTTVLLEAANWNFINIRRTVASQKLQSEAAYRFARGIHPALTPQAIELCLGRMAAWSGCGAIAPGLVDAYPLPYKDPVVTVRASDVSRVLGVPLSAGEIATLLGRLEFTCTVNGEEVTAQTPPHRCDIGEGVIGKADLLEEIARLVGYDHIPATRLSDTLPPQRRNLALEQEERVKNLLANLGLQETINYRMTSPEREARLYPPGAQPAAPEYVQIVNPIASDRFVMRRSLLTSVIEVLERNIRLGDRLAFFEIGPVFLPQAGEELPLEERRLAIVMTGTASEPAWDRKADASLDFYDLKGVLEGLVDGLHIAGAEFVPAAHPTFHPGKCAALKVGEVEVGVFGELHPSLRGRLELGNSPVLAADLNLDRLLAAIPARHVVASVPVFPPVLEDIAVVVDEATPASQVEQAIRQGGGKTLASVRLFDIFRGAQIGEGKKSLAYALVYQAPDRTLTDAEAKQVRSRIIRRLEQELGAKLRA